MNVQLKRKIEVNYLLIKARWFYATAIFLMGYFAYKLDIVNSEFSVTIMLLLFLVSLFLNKIISFAFSKIEDVPTILKVNILGGVSLTLETLVYFAIVYFIFEFNFLPYLFFILPIFSVFILFGFWGGFAYLFLLISFLNFFTFLLYNSFLGRVSEIPYDALLLSTFSVFYVLFGILIAFGSKLIFSREMELSAKTAKIEEEMRMRKDKMQDFDKTSNILLDRDKELILMNDKLDTKIKELKDAQDSQIRSFRDLQEARKVTQQEKEKTDAIISNFVDPIIVLDNKNAINLVNPAAERVFSLSKEDLGKKISKKDNYSMNNFKEILKIEYSTKTAKELKSDDESIEEITLVSGNGELTYKVNTAEVLDKNGEHLGTMKIFYNLTREKMIDKLKSEFISVAAHQLRTPLSAIKWSIEMILDGDAGPLNDEQRDMLDKGHKSNERIIGLVNDMLNVSRIEEGRFGYSFEKSNFHEVFDDVSSNLQGKIQMADLKFDVSIPDEVPDVYMDKSKMTMVLQNLLENAVKYTQAHGKLSLALTVEGKFLKIKVKDNGVGIPKDDQVKLFSKFFRASNVIKLQTEGSGLGLFIVKNVIEKHGGNISCVSEEGIGTEFIVTMPINEESPE